MREPESMRSCTPDLHIYILDEDYCAPRGRTCICGKADLGHGTLLILGPKSEEAQDYYRRFRP